MKKDIKLIIIDLYGVMTNGNFWNISRYLAKKYKLKSQDIYDVLYHKYFTLAATGKITERKLFENAIKDLKLKETFKSVRSRHMSFIKLNESVFKEALRLRNKGYKTLLLSKNVPSQFDEVIKKYNLDKHFDSLNTFCLKMDKRDKRVISHVLKEYKFKPEEAIMIDDQDFNLVEPRKKGVTTIHYKNFKDLKKQLHGYIK